MIAKPFFRPESDELRFLPEGPRVLRDGRLAWVAIQHGADARVGSVNVLDPASGVNRNFPLPGRPGFLAETTDPDVLFVGMERSLVCLNLRTGAVEPHAVEVTADERVIINDGLAVQGGVLFGTKDLELKRPIAALYFFDSATRKVHTVLDRQICSNGKFLRRDADGAALFDIDSIPKTISRYRLDAALRTVLEKSVLVEPDSLPGSPDGMRPAPDGESAIVAFYNPGAVSDGVAWQLRLRDGAVLCEWKIPGSPRVTCPEFIEIGGKVRIIFTTAVEGMPAETGRIAPGAGTLYIADTMFEKMPAPPSLVPVLA